MDRFAALQLFVRVVERGSFTKAAHEEGLRQPAASKQIAALEARLGTRLFNRTSRGLIATEAGRDFYVSAVRLLGDLDDAESRIGRRNVSPTGLVRVAIPAAFGRMYIVPRLPEFSKRYPDLDVELAVSERHVNLVEDAIDVALRIGFLGDSDLIARRIGSMRTITVATPGYLAEFGEPASPADLARHNQVIFRFGGANVGWRFKGADGPFVQQPTGTIRSNDAEHLRAAVLAGLGVGHNASWLYDADLAAGSVSKVLADFAPDPHPIQAVCAGGRHIPARVRFFIDFLAAICVAEPSLRLA